MSRKNCPVAEDAVASCGESLKPEKSFWRHRLLSRTKQKADRVEQNRRGCHYLLRKGDLIQATDGGVVARGAEAKRLAAKFSNVKRI